jgi:3-methyladenine DNA glycosylase AlkD
MTVTALVAAVRTRLSDAADPERAPTMQAYMKSALPYYGVPMPRVRAISRAVYADHLLTSRADWERAVRTLYDEASHREERYAALALVAHRRYRTYHSPDVLSLYEHLVLTGAWWDLVDELAHRVGDVLRAYRAETESVVRGWSKHADMWLRRTSILCQLGHRADTDTRLLTDVIAPSLGDREFFIRKAIGWALREYAKTDPDWVRGYVDGHRSELSPLSVREALKHLGG